MAQAALPVSSPDPNDWRARFRAQAVATAELATDARNVARVVSDRSGALEQFGWDQTTRILRRLTDRPFGTFWARLSPRGEFLFYLDDTAGDERGHLVRAPFGDGDRVDLTPDRPAYALAGLAIGLSGRRLAITIADREGWTALAFDDSSKEVVRPPRTLRKAAWLVEAVSDSGSLIVGSTSGARDETVLEALDWETGDVVGALSDGPKIDLHAVAASPVRGDNRVLATSNGSGYRRPLIWDPISGRRDDLRLDKLVGEVIPLDWDPGSGRVLLQRTADARQELYLHDPRAGLTSRLEVPSGTLGAWNGGVGFGREGDIIAVWQDSTHPPSLIAIDAQTGRRREVLIAAATVPASRPWRSVAFAATDGQRVQGWLATPPGHGPFPTIVHAHGGPEGCLGEVYDAESQTWVAHGFAFLTINYRGSTGFGTEFEQKIYGNPGYWEVEDLAAGREWLVNQGISRADAVLVAGTSYGGFLALQALGTRPELWAGAMAISPVADWFAQVEDASGPARDWACALLGGEPEDRFDQYVASSPISHIDRVRAPALLIAGRCDATVPPRGVARYEARMKALQRSVEAHWFDGGHFTLTRPDLLILHQELMLDFAERVLGKPGRASR